MTRKKIVVAPYTKRAKMKSICISLWSFIKYNYCKYLTSTINKAELHKKPLQNTKQTQLQKQIPNIPHGMYVMQQTILKQYCKSETTFEAKQPSKRCK